ncbi:TPA: electron transfer flavoprotein beta subunit/FixA family protein [Candidatus Poribacteria bacterium]|nr:electron transfer flavoprotein beta subunit/FixA family protein [Candidatus Poribacteria bacterium]
MLNSIVIVREVWDTRDLVGEIVEEGRIKEERLATRFEPEDLNALEMALRIKDQHGGKVTAISIGQPREIDVLRECLYRGVDGVIRLNDPFFADLDSLSTGYVLAQAIRRIGDFDLILSGVDVPEGENSLLASHVAQFLGVEQISYVDDIERISDGRVLCKRAVEMGYEFVEVELPVLLIVGVALVKDDPRAPRSAKARLKLKHKKTTIPTWRAEDIGISDLSELRAVRISGYDPVPEIVIESKEVDPEDENALKTMLKEILSV